MHATGNALEAHARFQPDAEAVLDVDGGRRWTYSELDRDSRRWAARLHRHGVRPGDRVAVLAYNRGETFALLFAASRLGATLFPMNWRLSPAEFAWQLGDAAPAAILVDAAHADVLDAPTLGIDDGPGTDELEGPGSDLGAAWQLMYTSGSSGRPKGALLTHRQLHWNAVNTTLACDLTPQCSTLTFTPLFHTGGMNCLSTPLLHRGGRVVLTRGLDVPQALGLIATERVSHLMGVPTIYQMLADHADFGTTDLTSVRDALCGGAALSSALLERYLDRGIPLRQGFGMTEVGPNCFSMPPHRVREKLGSVGLPIHHLAMRLVRPDGLECGVDEPGELLMRGPTVFGGYLANPAATAASFTDGWFRTGDVLARDADGFYTVRGRLKEMYISGGENVYPAEIEAVLHRAPGVAHAAVVGVPHPQWGEVGRAFIEPERGCQVTESALRDHLSGQLARFKLPKSYVIAAALPRTGSGKIDKPALLRERC
ncbi:MAG: fatty-acyl-CoA synthase [Myxococcota bacterium]|jgi:fatty-acyl-CoA synthase